MKVDISQGDPDGPVMVDLDTLLSHRVEVLVDGKALLSADVAQLFLISMIRGANVTRLDLGAPVPR